MNDASAALARLQAMPRKTMPTASDWWGPFAVQWEAEWYAPLTATILEMRAQGIVPVCKFIQRLPRGRYRFIITQRQLERIIAFHHGIQEIET